MVVIPTKECSINSEMIFYGVILPVSILRWNVELLWPATEIS
jgi:hypothetical protein